MLQFESRLGALENAGLTRKRRVVTGQQGAHLDLADSPCLSFCGNDYLGLASHPALTAAAQRGAAVYGVGAGASHLLCGHNAAHAQLEDALASFVRLSRALYFSTGYMAALGTIPALTEPGDTIFSDALNHASLIDGTRLSRADVHVYPHADVDALDDALGNCTSPHKLVVSDAVFSMDGDIAPVPELLALCERHDAMLLLDDAHGFGVVGEGGRGVLSHFGLASPRIVYMGTLGKAAGVSGAFVAGPHSAIEWLLQRARTYIFTTATPPLLAMATIESLRLIEEENWRREHLAALIRQFRAGLVGLPWRLLPSSTPIQPLVVGGNRHAVELSEALFKQGIWVPAIRPPTVPAGSARLRISLSAAHSEGDVDRLIETLQAADTASCADT
jgi:8-amino-7-oxononanoate synthase